MNPFAALIEPPRFIAMPPSVRAPRRAPKVAERKYGNPWKLTPGECAALTAVAKTGCNKAAGRALGVAFVTIEAHLANARKKMGAANRVLCLLAWDRYTRGCA